MWIFSMAEMVFGCYDWMKYPKWKEGAVSFEKMANLFDSCIHHVDMGI